jgi:RNA polymerase sigma factor FliA
MAAGARDDGSDDEMELWSRYGANPSPALRETLFTRHANFARNIARRHYREKSWGDIEFADLSQFAFAGLLEAIDRFDPKHGAPFRAFAAHRISGSITDGIARANEMREQVSWRHRLRRERLSSLAERSDVASPIEKLAEIAGGLALGFMLEGTGLLFESEEDKASSSPETAYESVAWNELVGELKSAIPALPERERTILERHYVDGLSFDQLALLLSLSKGRISQLHRAALARLRKRMRERGHFRMLR